MSVMLGAIVLAVYLAGSVNFAILVLSPFGKGDPRHEASGNPGTFNVYRQHGLLWASSVFVLDLGRAAGAAVLGVLLLPVETLPWVGLALILGNRYPVFHRFRGGKGVANYLGFSMVLVPAAAAISALVWVGLYKLSREAFIGSFGMVGVLAGGTCLYCGRDPAAGLAVAVTVSLIVLGHWRNIAGAIVSRDLREELACPQRTDPVRMLGLGHAEGGQNGEEEV